MARYYTENLNGRIEEVVAQDETGVYRGSLFHAGKSAPEIRIASYRTLRDLWIKLPEWEKPQEVSTATREHLDFVRRMERSSYMRTTPSEIREMPGNAEQVIREVFRQAGAAVVVTSPLPQS